MTQSTRVITVVALLMSLAVGAQAQTPEIDALRTQAEQGDADAQFILGVGYARGLGVPQDDAEAVRLLQRDGGVDVGYYYYDVDGYVADGPSGHGLLGLREAVDGPAFREFLDEGATERLDELAAELADATSEHEGVREMIATLRCAAKRASGVLILTDGVGFEDE